MSANPFQPATRAQLKARVALEGPTGAGKTWTGLEWAHVLADGGKVAVVDTERGSASLYSDRFTFDVVTFEPPYEPGRLVEILKAAETHGYAVVVIDSLSHFWEGEGGTLDMVDAAASRSGGNQFAGWKVGTPALRHLVDTMLGLDAHLIATMRSKMEYVLSENERGKKVPQKVGMAPVMRAGVEYEFTLVGDLDLEHRLTITKSRCDLLADQVVQPGRAAEAAEQFMGWLGQGEPLASRADVDALVARMDAIGDELRRKACKRAFRDELGMPSNLRESQLVAADALVARFEAEGGGPPDDDPGSPTAPPSPELSGGGAAADPPPSAPTPGADRTGGESAAVDRVPGVESAAEAAPSGAPSSGTDDPGLVADGAGDDRPSAVPAPSSPKIEPGGGDAGSPPVPREEPASAPSGPVTIGDLLNRMTGVTAATRKGRLLKIAQEVAREHTMPVPEALADISDELLGLVAAGLPAPDPREKARAWMHATWGLNGGNEARKDAISVHTSGRTDSSNDLSDEEWAGFMTVTKALPNQLAPRDEGAAA